MEQDYQYGYYAQDDEVVYENDQVSTDSDVESCSYHNLIPFLTYFIAVLLGGINVVIISGIVLTFVCGLMCMAGKQNVCQSMIGYLALISMYLGGITHIIALPYGSYLLYKYLETRIWLPIAFIIYELLIATFLIFRLFKVCFFEEMEVSDLQQVEIKQDPNKSQEIQNRSRSNSIDRMHQALRWSVLFPGRNMRSISSHVSVDVDNVKTRSRSISTDQNLNKMKKPKEEIQPDKK